MSIHQLGPAPTSGLGCRAGWAPGPAVVLLGCLGHVREGGPHDLVAGVHALGNVSHHCWGWHPAPTPGLFLR